MLILIGPANEEIAERVVRTRSDMKYVSGARRFLRASKLGHTMPHVCLGNLLRSRTSGFVGGLWPARYDHASKCSTEVAVETEMIQRQKLRHLVWMSIQQSGSLPFIPGNTVQPGHACVQAAEA
jgi:hypothetical protein